MPAESWLYCRVHNSPEDNQRNAILLCRGEPKHSVRKLNIFGTKKYTQLASLIMLWNETFEVIFKRFELLLQDFEKLGMQYSKDAFLFFLRQIIMQLGIAGLGLLQSSRRSHEFPLMTAPCRYLLATTLPKFLISCQFWAAAAKLELIFQFPYWRAAAMQSSPKIRHHQLQKRET